MANASNGLMAGFVATMVLSLIMVAKGMMGLMPELEVIAMLGSMMNAAPAFGWVVHFMIGIFAWGLGFAMIFNFLPGSSRLRKGISFGIAAWFLMMLVVMPMAGAGLFGLNVGVMAPVITLMLHAIYGAVLGLVFIGPGTAVVVKLTNNTDSA